MEVNSITIFSHRSTVPEFDNSLNPVFRIYSGPIKYGTPTITIFFADQQEAINFKNAVIQSWETSLRKTGKEKS
jgi:hypothetical protein